MQAPKPTHLRLVVNRDSTPPITPANKSPRRSKVAVATVEEVPGDADLARQLIMDFNLGTQTIREAIAAVDKKTANHLDQLTLYVKTTLMFTRLGIQLYKNEEEDGPASNAHATLWDPKPMKRHIPALKKLKVKWEGLPLY